MSRPRRPAWLRLPNGPAGRAGSALVAVMLLVTVLAVSTGVGYTVARPLLGDGSAFLSRGHTVAHVNGETGKSDAQTATELATGSEPIQTVRLPDGRVAIVNKTTGTVTIIDGSTMAPAGPPQKNPGGGDQLEALATDSSGYLVDRKTGTVTQLAAPGKTAAPAVPVRQGIVMAVPSGDSVWVLAKNGQVIEVAKGRAVRTVRLGAPVSGLTVADDHPVAVTTDGRAYVVDPDEPHALGDLGLTGPDIVFGSWRGAGRYVMAVDRRSGRVSVLDPRTRHTVRADLPVAADAKLDAPVVLGGDVYVPEYTKSELWRVGATTGKVDKPLQVPPGRAGDTFDLTVSGGHVWANSQYDRRALVVDGDRHEHQADKGAGPDVRDSQADPQAPPPPVKMPRTPLPAGPPARRDDSGNSGPSGKPAPRHATPLKVPSVVGLSRQAACHLITSAKLSCARRMDATPVVDPDQVSVVTAQDPKPGVIPSDKKVTITYPDRFTVPSVVSQTQGEACSRLRKFTMKCRATMGVAATGANQPGMVYSQTPAAGTEATEGTPAQLLFYSGTGTTHDYKGQNIDAACGQVQADGFGCNRTEGVTAAGTGAQPGTVYAQDVPPNTKRNIRQPVTLTYYSPNNALPSYVGSTPDAACADISARGFTCQRTEQPYPSTNKVEAQDQPAGTYPIGTQITVHYSPWELVDYWVYRRNDVSVWAMRPHGAVPPNYGEPSFHVGLAYKPGEAIPSAQAINGFSCVAGDNACNGLPENHFYSRIGSYKDWQGPMAAATFMACGTAGTVPIYRVWKNENNNRYYGITSDPASWGAADQELLGCVWP
ncbi:MAG: PASTA domain-containing protein [Actinoallomurus sp.]